MADLTPRSPAADLLPLSIGDLHLTEAAEVPVHVLQPYRGQQVALSTLLQQTLGLALPDIGHFVERTATPGTPALRLTWCALDQWMLIGAPPPDAAAGQAALVDHSDAWCRVRLEGPGAADVLARLVPLDLSPATSPPGRTHATMIGHMSGLVMSIAPEAFEIMVFRSMAGTLVHDLDRAMRQVAARARR